jgi:hypothetical protein
MSKTTKPFSILLVAVLTFHFAAATIGSKWSCQCYKNSHEITSCCNCPTCLTERGGLYSYCSIQAKTGSGEGKSEGPSFKSLRCTCGSQDPLANAKSPVPFIPHSGPACFLLPFLGPIQIAEIPPDLDDIDLSLLVPG